MGKPLGSWLGERSSRRGFLARAGATVVGAGAVLMTKASAAEAACTGCCCTSCASLGRVCPTTVDKCPTHCSWNKYQWDCCGAGRIVICWDCFCPGRTQCFCQKYTQAAC
jgi:hypothetical protein